MKKLLGVVLAVLLVLTDLPHGADVISGDMTSGLVTTAWAENAEETHTHCVCNKTANPGFTGHTHNADQTWTPVNSLSDITKEGYYYLTNNVTVSSSWQPQNGVVLCLNGHSIEQSGTGSVIYVWGTTLTLTDCKSDGEQGKIKHVVDPSTGTVHYNPGVYIISGTFNMYGGCITENTSGFHLEGGDSDPGYGGGVYVGSRNTTVNGSAVFNMYGGTITGNTADQGGKGGGVYVQSGRTFNMYGGTISGNTTDAYGGGVFVESGATFTMSGTASITKNTAGKTDDYGFGGGVYSLGTFNLSGGAITENTANCTNFTNQLGGGVMAAGGKLNLSGNPVVKDNIGKDTDNVRVDGATMEVTAALTEGAEIVLNSLKDPTINPTGKSGEWYTWNDETKTLTAGTGGESGGETDVAVKSVTLNKTTLSLVAGSSETLTATVTPDNATNKNVTWSSNNESVAKVENGKVTAVSEGTAIITVTTQDGGKTATCTVTVTAQSGGHSHVFSTDWTKDATHHWHTCTVEGCTEVDSCDAHVYDNDADATCNVCGYTRTISGGETTPTNRYYYYSTGSTGTKQDTTKNGPKTGDAGMLVYLGLALSSYTGTALAVRRKREF